MRKFFLPALICACATLLVGCKNNSSNGPVQLSSNKVLTLVPKSLTISEPFSCVIVGDMDVAIRPKITAFIEEQHVNEGDFVSQGQLLFTLEDVQIRANLNVAKANIEVAKAQVETAELTLNSKKELHKRNIISDYELQLAQNDVKVKESNLAQSKAQYTNAEKELAYTRVTSPTAGIVGIVSLSPGNLVGPNSEKPLTTVSKISVMRAYFSMSERQTLNLSRQYGSFQKMIDQMPPVSLELSDGSAFPHKGKLITISGSVDQSTGAIRARVNFPNPEYTIKSGYTGKILIPYVLDSVFEIPQSASFEVQDKHFVYVVNPKTKEVNAHAIVVHNLNDGANFIVLSGLSAGDQIVTQGANFLKEGQKINPVLDQPEKETQPTKTGTGK